MPQTPNKPPLVHVAAALLVRDGRVLAAERSYGPHLGFELPGGKVEPGETPLEACRRELREELGIEVRGTAGLAEPRRIARVHHAYDDFTLQMDVFLAAPAEGTAIRDTEHLRLLWLDRDELLSVAWLPADVRLLRDVRSHWDELVG